MLDMQITTRASLASATSSQQSSGYASPPQQFVASRQPLPCRPQRNHCALAYSEQWLVELTMNFTRSEPQCRVDAVLAWSLHDR